MRQRTLIVRALAAGLLVACILTAGWWYLLRGVAGRPGKTSEAPQSTASTVPDGPTSQTQPAAEKAPGLSVAPPESAPAPEPSAHVILVESLRADQSRRACGIVIGHGIVVTSRSAVDGAGMVWIRDEKALCTVTAIRPDSSLDLAMLELSEPGAFPPAPVRGKPAQSGEAVQILVRTSPNDVITSHGTIAGMRSEGPEQFIELVTPLPQATSVSGLFDTDGQLVGIMTVDSEGAPVVVPATRASRIDGRQEALATPAAPEDSDASSETADVFTTEMDVMRERGAKEFEAAVADLAVKANELDKRWEQFVWQCSDKYLVGNTGGHVWFGLWDGYLIPLVTIPPCAGMWEEIETMSNSIRRGMADAEDAARRNWVYPGIRRDIRQRYGMDWKGWDQ